MGVYVGWREIKDATGRFGLISGVIALLAFMVVMLSSLTAGLSDQSTSAMRALPDGVWVQSGADGGASTLTDSRLDEETVGRIRAADSSAQVLGVANTRVSVDGRAASVAAFGSGDEQSVTVDPETATALGLAPGSSATVGTSTVRIETIADAGMYAHQPVLRMPYDLWVQATGRDGASAVVGGGAVTAPAGAVWTAHGDLTALVPGYSSEHSSLLLIQGLLLVISAVVVGGFFAVWTGQRVQSLAVVRALGGSRGYLFRDGLGQAAVVLVAGLAAGTAFGGLGVWAASGTVPVLFDAASTALLLAAMAVLGLLGAGLALRPLATVDPLDALNR